MRVTLSYFIEPTASRRGWRRRYAYASHGLRFELKTPVETVEEFVQRVNRDAQAEEDGSPTVPRLRRGALVPRPQPAQHRLAAPGHVGGHGRRPRRVRRPRRPRGRRLVEERQAQGPHRQPVRYSLIVSLRTGELGVDLYTPVEIANEQLVPTRIAIPV